MRAVLLLGRMPFDLDQVHNDLGAALDGVTLRTSRDDVLAAFDAGAVDSVGAGLEMATVLAVVQYVFEHSDTTTVHMKGPRFGMIGHDAVRCRPSCAAFPTERPSPPGMTTGD